MDALWDAGKAIMLISNCFEQKCGSGVNGSPLPRVLDFWPVSKGIPQKISDPSSSLQVTEQVTR
jgi:hypothetical protein